MSNTVVRLGWLLIVLGADFIVNQPAAGTVWQNGNANLVTWTKGVLDGIDGLDVEMSRLSQDGLIYVARDGELRPLSGDATLFCGPRGTTSRRRAVGLRIVYRLPSCCEHCVAPTAPNIAASLRERPADAVTGPCRSKHPFWA